MSMTMKASLTSFILVSRLGYKPATDASGSYAVSGACFFVVLYFVIFAFGEVSTTYSLSLFLLGSRCYSFRFLLQFLRVLFSSNIGLLDFTSRLRKLWCARPFRSNRAQYSANIRPV